MSLLDTYKGYVYAFAAALILAFGFGLYIYIGSIKFQLATAKLGAQTAKTDLEKYNQAIMQAAEDMNKTNIRIVEKIQRIREAAEPEIRYIETYIGDTNATDCVNAHSLINSTVF